MRAVLYGMAHSHPVHAARLMLERKGVEHRVVNILPGLHPLVVRAVGFRGGSVPALRIAGRRVQGTRRISRALDQLHPEPALVPADPAARRAVEEAERWGEAELQPVPRRIFRWGLQHRNDLRKWMAREVVGIPGPLVGAAGAGFAPIGVLYARISAADEATVRADLQNLPALLDHCDALVADGVIGTGDVNAADCQILASVRLFLAMDDLRPLVEGRPCGDAALRLRPDFPGPAPAMLPPGWVPGPAG
jgi:glutathione S-transferase